MDLTQAAYPKMVSALTSRSPTLMLERRNSETPLYDFPNLHVPTYLNVGSPCAFLPVPVT